MLECRPLPLRIKIVPDNGTFFCGENYRVRKLWPPALPAV